MWKYLTAAIAALVITSAARADRLSSQAYYRHVADSMNVELSQAITSGDSIDRLINLFDIEMSVNIENADRIAEHIYELSMRTGDHVTALEMLRNIASNNVRNHEVLNGVLARARDIETADPTLGRETTTYVQMMINSWYNLHTTDSQRIERFDNALETWTLNPPEDIYDQVVLLHSVCLSVAQHSTGELFKKYLNQLETLISRLPRAQYSIRYSYYSQAATNYYNAGYPDLGLDATRRTVEVLDSIEVYNQAKGRPFKRYNSIRFRLYTRAMSDYKNLDRATVERYYTLARKYRDLSPNAITDKVWNLMLEIYHAMSAEDYAKAYPLLQEVLEQPLTRTQTMWMLPLGIKCARHYDDRDRLLTWLSRYNDILQEKINTNSDNNLREYQLFYEIAGLNRDSLAEAKTEAQRAISRRDDIIIVMGIIAGLLLIACGIMTWLNLRLRRSRTAVTTQRDTLQAERQHLLLTQGKLARARDEAHQAYQQKSDFLRNLGRELGDPLSAITEYSQLLIDCTDATDKKYLTTYADLISSNCAFLNAVFSDVFEIGQDKTGDALVIHNELTDVRRLIGTVIDTVKPALIDGVELFIKEGCADYSIMVDRARFFQIMLNLLRNAVTYTRQGYIIVSWGLVNDGTRLAISVTDTGPGIDPAIIDKVFDRGVIGRNIEHGPGLGLPISRLLAHLLNGDIMLDTSYTAGARFVITLPYMDRNA